MSLPNRTTVLIVGAGPAGLATALSLLHYGFHDFVVVDAIAQGTNASRAAVVHPATLESLDTVGCGEEIASQGMKFTSFGVGTRSRKLFGPQMESLKSYTRHPYMLLIPQCVTESVLEKKLESLGVTVHRPFKVVGLKRNADDPCLSDVTLEDGRVITAKYVIGADGAHSVIRTMTGIGFSDPVTVEGEESDNVAQMVLADVTFENLDSDEDVPNVTISQDGISFFFAFPTSFNELLSANGQFSTSERIYRIVCGVPLSEGEIPHSPSKEYLQDLINRFGPYHLSPDASVNPSSKPTYIKDVIWHSRFRNRASIADRVFARLGTEGQADGKGGVVLLIGDAAHIHSPAGGQGMNLGLRDAIFLGEALTKHIHANKGKSPSEADDDATLYEFATVRHERALEVIKLTKRILSIWGMKHREWMAWWCPIDSTTVRSWGLWLLGYVPFVRSKTAWELSGLGRM